MTRYAPDDLEDCCAGARVRRVYDQTVIPWPWGTVIVGERTVRYECASCNREIHTASEPPEPRR